MSVFFDDFLMLIYKKFDVYGRKVDICGGESAGLIILVCVTLVESMTCV